MDVQPPPQIDQAALDKYLPGWREDQAILREMVTLYISDTGKRLGALRAAIADKDLAQVRDLLGHASMTTTERYDNQTLENLQLAVRELEARARVCRDKVSRFFQDRGVSGAMGSLAGPL